ncbi:MAG TPA: UDP-N-acetylglucosamine--N-acetylmuramyl-(pentapeptide) pyrophosphoryl-undecaprenol N-acetylglucosamine transferase [Phycisphaerales bacterium]|nr:UDP-N-acetylglucosamine--N-acetylmuramyl-(pentapeptide) pyrophosphoryl-undecaprenol N-acetylglucosamine transferase [Phycisphaerales bacterium]
MGAVTYIFAGGGTGGHLYPGLAIAEQIRRLSGDARVMFLCSDREIDRKVLEPEGVVFRALPAKPIGVRPRALWRFVSNWPASVRATRAAIRSAREDGGAVRMVALGGFVAAPAVQAARVERVPVTLVNIDAVPGKANRWIARRSTGRAFTTYADAAHPAWRTISPIVRSAAAAPRDRTECRRRLGLDPARPTLMVTGGSLGASSINRLMAGMAERSAEAFSLGGWQVIHQCGNGEAPALEAAYGNAGIRAVVAEFTREIGVWWGAADLAIARAGAGSVAEAWCNRVPCVFLPYPYHADDHQRLNAGPLVDRGAAVVCVDRVEPGPNLDEAGRVIERLLREPGALRPMAAAAAGLPPADGAAVVAAFLVQNAG